MNTFIGAVIVTIFSSWSFFVFSSRVELSANLAALSRQLADVLSACAMRFDYEALSPEHVAAAGGTAKKIAGLGGPIAQLEVLLADVQTEPNLWRAPVRDDQARSCLGSTRADPPLSQWQALILACKKVATELSWLDAATMGFVLDVQETKEG